MENTGTDDNFSEGIKESLRRNSFSVQQGNGSASAQEHRRNRLALETSEIGVWDWDLTKGTVVWNEMLFRLLELEPVEGPISFEVFYDHIYPADRERVQMNVDECLKEGAELDIEFRVLTKGGKLKWIKSKGSILIGDDSKPIRLIGVNYDITDRIRAEESVRAERDFTDSILETSGALLVVLNKKGQVVRFNRACEKATGYTEREVQGRLFFDFLIPEDEIEGVRHVWESLKKGDFPKTHENSWLRKDGSTCLISWSNTAITDSDGNIEFIIGSGLDMTEQRRLKRRIEYLSRFPEENPNPVLRIQADGLLRYANAGAEPVITEWGIGTGDTVRGKWLERIHQTLNTGLPLTVETEAGEDIYSFTIAPVADMDYVNLYGTCITELRNAYERDKKAGMIRAASQTALETIEAMKEGVALIDLNGFIQSVNPALVEMTGFAFGYLEGKDIREIFRSLLVQADLSRARELLDKALKGESISMGEMTLLTLDGKRLPIVPRIVFIKDEKGSPVSIVLTVQDISDLEAANREIRENERRLSEAQKIAHIGNWEWNLVNQKLRWSDEAYRIFGLEKDSVEMSYEQFLDYIHPEDRETVENAVAFSLEQEQPYTVSHRILRPDGEIRFVNEQGHLFRDDSGAVKRMVGTVQDVTEQRELEMALNAQDKLASLGRVAAGIAHEIRNPLSGMQIFMDTIRKRVGRGDLDTEWLLDITGQMKDASRRIDAVIKRVMDFARPAVPTFTTIDLNNAVREAVDLGRVSMRKSGVSLKTEFAEGPLYFRGDSQMIGQVVLNLMINSSEAMAAVEGEKRIQIRTESDAQNLKVVVSDTGPGIPDEEKEKIFEPFYSRKHEGTGIGLNLCRRIISDHEGSIYVFDSQTGGAEFTVNIPAARKPEENNE